MNKFIAIGVTLLFLFARKKASANTNTFSFLGDASLPRGIRNNNPGNIRLANNNWLGKVPEEQNTDGDFEQFTTIIYGTRAMIKLTQNHIKNGFDSIDSLINKYAPPSENNTENYINFISEETGISRFQILTPNDKNTLQKLIKVMSKMENGIDIISNNIFNKAWQIL